MIRSKVGQQYARAFTLFLEIAATDGGLLSNYMRWFV
jgi:hypothetical protein